MERTAEMHLRCLKPCWVGASFPCIPFDGSDLLLVGVIQVSDYPAIHCEPSTDDQYQKDDSDNQAQGLVGR